MRIENIDENLSMNISDTRGVSLQVSDVDDSLEMNISTNDIINLNIINKEGNIGMEVETGDSKVQGTNDHSKLKNLDYAHSGHTGFQPKGDYIEDKNYVHTDNNFTTAEKNKLESLSNYDDTLIKKDISSNTSQINALKNSIENKADKSEIPNVSNFITKDNLTNYYTKGEVYSKEEINELAKDIPDVSNFITNTVDNLVNYYLKSEVYNKDEINELASTIQTVNIKVVDALPTQGQTNIIYFVAKNGSTNDVYDEWIYINSKWEHIGNTQIDLTDYATKKWVEDKKYMPIKDFQEYMPYIYYDKSQIDEKFKGYYNKEEIDGKLENLPTGGTELTGGDNTVIEDNAINVYTNTGYKISDKDIKLQSILTSVNNNGNKMIYTLDEKIIIYDGTNEIRWSENGIDFEIIELPCRCAHLTYNESNKRLYGTDNISNFFYSDDNGITWNLLNNTRASNITNMDVGFGAGFRSIYRSTKEIITWYFNETSNTLSQNTRLNSTIYPDFIVMANNTQYIWCNSSGTFKYGAGSREADFTSLSGVTVNMLKRVNNVTIAGLAGNDKLYVLEPATSITAYKWVECRLPDTCTINDVIFNPYDETYYLLTNINTYYKTKDFIEFESVDKDGLRGKQGHFTLMGIQAITSEKNKLLLAPTRTTQENKNQEFDRALDKKRWAGDGLIVDGDQIRINARSPLMVNSNGIGLTVLEDYNLPDFVIEGVYVAIAEEKDLFDPYEIENWYYSGDAFPEESYKAVKFLFNQAGSFYNQVTWEEEYSVEQYEYGYLFYDQNMSVFKYVKLGNKSWMFE